MAVPNSDEDKYANESFEADSDVVSEYGSPELHSEGDELDQRQEATGTKNMALLASTRDRQMIIHGMIGPFARNKDVMPFDSSSEDDDDVVFSQTVAEINAEGLTYDITSNSSRRNSASLNMSKMEQIIETTEDDSDFQQKLTHKQNVFSEEHAFVSDVSEELEMEMEMQVYKNQAHLVQPLTPTNQIQGQSVAEQTDCSLMQDLAHKIQKELHNKKRHDIDSVAKMVAQAMSTMSIEENCREKYEQNVYSQATEATMDDSNNSCVETTKAEVDLTHLRGSKSYTVLRAASQYKNPFNRISSIQSSSSLKLRSNYNKNMNADIDPNLDSPKHYKPYAIKLQDMASHIETESCHETETDNPCNERKMIVHNNRSDTQSFRSSASEQRLKLSRSACVDKLNNQPKSGTTNRKSWTFTNDRMRQIENDNRILLQKILTQKPTVPKPKKPTKNLYLPPSTFVSNAAIERKKKQRQIDLDNQILKRKLESVTYRRKPFCY